MSVTAVSPAARGISHAQAVRLARLGVVVAALVIWQGLSSAGMSAQIVPGPVAVARAVGRLLGDAGLVQALLATLLELAFAFLIAVLIGGAMGYGLSVTLRAEQIGMPILLMIYALPQITILPLFILYFGLGPAGKVAFGVSHGLFPVALAVHAGLKNRGAVYHRWATSLGASPWRRFYRVSLPQLLPAMCTGMRLAMSLTLLGVLLAELYVSSLGIGFYVQIYTNALQADALFALVFLLAAIAIALNGGVRWLERRMRRWDG